VCWVVSCTEDQGQARSGRDVRGLDLFHGELCKSHQATVSSPSRMNSQRFTAAVAKSTVFNSRMRGGGRDGEKQSWRLEDDERMLGSGQQVDGGHCLRRAG
jgi:hypothetical protein